MSKFSEDLYDADGNKVKTVTWQSIDGSVPETGTPVPDTFVTDVDDAHEAAIVQNDAYTIEHDVFGKEGDNETQRLIRLRQRWGVERYIAAFDMWEDLYL